jgi:hypothetical protein
MTNFRSEETRRHDGMAEVEGSKWFQCPNHENPFGPTNVLMWNHDPDVNRWFENVKRGSSVTAYEWIRRLGRIQKEFGMSLSRRFHWHANRILGRL